MSEISISAASANVLRVVERWHAFMRGEDPVALEGLLDDDVVMYSPVVFTPQRGKAIVTKYLTAARTTFAAVGFGAVDGPTFRYVKHLADGDTVMLEFETEMNGKYVNGVDIIGLNSEGRIVEFRVMVRPLQALNNVHQLMGAELEAMAARDSG